MNSKRLTTALLFGGKSGEHEVSCISCASVYQNLDAERFDKILIGIDHEGVWYLQSTPSFNDDTSSLRVEKSEKKIVHPVPGKGLYADGAFLEIDVVLPILHGTFGEDGTIQGLLELCDLPYTGAGVLGSSLCMDKAAVKRIWLQAGLPIIPFEELREVSWLRSSMECSAVRKALERFGFPLFVKPARTGSSVGVTRCTDRASLEVAIVEAFRYDTKILLEPLITGREIECSVIGNEKLESFPPGEIIPNHSFYNYEAKYIDPKGAELTVPAELSKELSRELRRISMKAYRVAEVEGFSRVDCFIEKGSNRVLLNEINTIPGFTGISMFSKMCAAGGLSYHELLEELIDLAIQRKRARDGKIYQWS
jgi:D-alanine-D-alanine ligase